MHVLECSYTFDTFHTRSEAKTHRISPSLHAHWRCRATFILAGPFWYHRAVGAPFSSGGSGTLRHAMPCCSYIAITSPRIKDAGGLRKAQVFDRRSRRSGRGIAAWLLPRARASMRSIRATLTAGSCCEASSRWGPSSGSEHGTSDGLSVLLLCRPSLAITISLGLGG